MAPGKRNWKRKASTPPLVEVFHYTFDELLNDEPTYASVQRTSADGRRLHAESVPIPPPSPVKKKKTFSDFPDDQDFDFDVDKSLWSNADSNAGPGQSGKAKSTRKHYKSSVSHPATDGYEIVIESLLQDQPLKEWMPLRDEYLQEFMRLEGPGDSDLLACSYCAQQDGSTQQEPAIFRCHDCIGASTCAETS
ncbi:hypothetical protein HGRIS_014830 [Hohenbuehelia grisea]|uniref:Uncharacterized protein n=1 Tax=Hohenbuehelia grisea TaxID=104357 RepID=A0ABR3IQW0_9AGAR